MKYAIDVNENAWSLPVLKTLLLDRTTKRNIIWGTDNYSELGDQYFPSQPIYHYLIMGSNSQLIMPRVLKNKEIQTSRTKQKAEVFTPSWVCNQQNNLADEHWFGRANVFNFAPQQPSTDTNTSYLPTTWQAQPAPIVFPTDKQHSWQAYVDEPRLEITCGEAPYLVSRYDAASGIPIDLMSRIGLLDRKLRVVFENTTNEADWFKWTTRAFQSIYGYEFQGDNLLIARENLLLTFIDYTQAKLQRDPTEQELLAIATIISWNLWQMDGLTCTIPFNKVVQRYTQYQLFSAPEPMLPAPEVLCLVKDWRANKIITFKSLLQLS